MSADYTVQSIIGRRVVPDGGCIEYQVCWSCGDAPLAIEQNSADAHASSCDDRACSAGHLPCTWEPRSALLESCASAVQSADESALHATDAQLHRWHRNKCRRWCDADCRTSEHRVCAESNRKHAAVTAAARAVTGQADRCAASGAAAGQSAVSALPAQTSTQRMRAMDDAHAEDNDEPATKRPRIFLPDHVVAHTDGGVTVISDRPDAHYRAMHGDTANRHVQEGGSAVDQTSLPMMRHVHLGGGDDTCNAESGAAPSSGLEQLYGLLWHDAHTPPCVYACEPTMDDTGARVVTSIPSSPKNNNSNNTGSGGSSDNHDSMDTDDGSTTATLSDTDRLVPSAATITTTPTTTKTHASAILLGELILSEQASHVLNNSKRGRKVGAGAGEAFVCYAPRHNDKTHRYKRPSKNSHHVHSHHGSSHGSSAAACGAATGNSASHRKGGGGADLAVQAMCEPALHLESRWRERFGVSATHSCGAPHTLVTPLQSHFEVGMEPDSVLAAQERAMAGDLCIVGLCPLEQSCSGEAATFARHVSVVPMIGTSEMERLRRESALESGLGQSHRGGHHHSRTHGSGSTVDFGACNHVGGGACHGADFLGSNISGSSNVNHAHLNAAHELVRDRKEQLVVRYLIRDHMRLSGDAAEAHVPSSVAAPLPCGNGANTQGASSATQNGADMGQRHRSMRSDAVEDADRLSTLATTAKPRVMVTSMPLSVFRFAFPQLLLDYLLRHSLVIEED